MVATVQVVAGGFPIVMGMGEMRGCGCQWIFRPFSFALCG